MNSKFNLEDLWISSEVPDGAFKTITGINQIIKEYGSSFQYAEESIPDDYLNNGIGTLSDMICGGFQLENS